MEFSDVWLCGLGCAILNFFMQASVTLCVCISIFQTPKRNLSEEEPRRNLLGKGTPSRIMGSVSKSAGWGMKGMEGGPGDVPEGQ